MTLRMYLLFLLAGAALGQDLDDPRLRHEIWASGIERPLGFDFIGPGELFIFENTTGRVMHVRDGQVENELLDLVVGDRGGLGLAVSPNFATDRFVFLHATESMTGQDGGLWSGTRILRYRYDGQELVDPLTLLQVPFDPSQTNGTNHDSGTLRFGPDGMLYGLLGDKHRGGLGNGRIEQNTGLAPAGCGVIFRLASDGTVPADNPFANHAIPGVRPWYVTGFRNSLGLTFDPQTDSLWFTDNGPDSYDELNRAIAGMNGGWLKIMGPDDRDAIYAENGGNAYGRADLVLIPGATYRDPEFSWAVPIGITAAGFVPARRFPEDLWGDLWVADFLGRLTSFEMTSDRLSVVPPSLSTDRVADTAPEAEEPRFGSGFGTVTEWRFGPDGYLYLCDYYGGNLRRIRPVVDRVEPTGMQILAGQVRSGSVEALGGLEIGELILHRPARIGLGQAQLQWQIELAFALEAGDPLQLEFDLNGSLGSGAGTARLEAFQPATATWVPVGSHPVGTMPGAHIDALPAPADQWVEPGTGRVRLRLEVRAHAPAAPGLVGSSPASPRLQLVLNRARLRATLP